MTPDEFKPNDEVTVMVVGRVVESNPRGMVLDYYRPGQPGKLIPMPLHVMVADGVRFTWAPTVSPAVRQRRIEAHQLLAERCDDPQRRRTIRTTLPYVGSTERPDLSVVQRMATDPLEVGGPVERPEVVCLAGAAWFADAFDAVGHQQALEGRIVVVAMSGAGLTGDTAGDPDVLGPGLELLDQAKVDLSSRVVVVNPGGCVDHRTQRLIRYAQSQDKAVAYLCPPTEDGNATIPDGAGQADKRP